MAERDCFREEFKRYKKKSTDLRGVLDVRNPEHFKLFKGRGRWSNKANNQFSYFSCAWTSEVELLQSPPDSYRADCKRLGLKLPSKWHLFSLPCNPGLLLLPDLFQRGCQHHWVRRCLVDYPCKPNICNLDAHMERAGRGCLWPAENSTRPGSCEPPESKKSRTSSAKTEEPLEIAKDSPLYRLRWVTLGYHYDWDKKEYCSENRSPFPEDLGTLSSFILHCAGFPGCV